MSQITKLKFGGTRFEFKSGSLDSAIETFPFEPDEFLLRFSARGVQLPEKNEVSEKEYMRACAAGGFIPFSRFSLELTSEGTFEPKISPLQTLEQAETRQCIEEVVLGVLEGKKFYTWEFNGDWHHGHSGIEGIRENFLNKLKSLGYSLTSGGLVVGRGYREKIDVQILSPQTAVLRDDVNSGKDKVAEIYAWLRKLA